MTAEELKKIPKIDLHCHLDGSLSKSFLEKRLGRTVLEEEITVSDECGSLKEYLEKFALPCSCLLDEEGLEAAGYDVLATMSLETVCYAEIRFAPLLSVTESMDCEHVIAALLRGLEKGKKEFGIEYNVITCAMRHHSEEENFRMIKTAREFLGAGVCAADLAGAEAQYPMSVFMELFRKTKNLGMPFTIHAGECQSAKNIEDAVRAGANRIGHGIAMQGNTRLKEMVRDAMIGVELCPISNLQTKAVKNPKEYPIREFLDAGIAVSVNTDNRTVSHTSLTRDLEWVQKMYEISDREIWLLMENAAKTAFVDDDKKADLCQKIKMR
ncbi:MAG: adenosine deaminase [Fusicatenibacter sp.]|nr:adenosine deaminase [Fusicatenibacter sp.]